MLREIGKQAHNMAEIELDTTCCSILAALQGNSRISNIELVEQVNLSPLPCLRRVLRLEEMGIIRS